MVSTWFALAIASLPVAGAIVVAFVPRWAEVRERRRTRYAEAVQALVAWAEFPYRVARRVGDDPEILAELVRLGHDLQEKAAFHEAWVSVESRAVGRLYKDVANAIRSAVGPAIQIAWTKPPVTAPEQMNMDNLGIDRAAMVDLLSRIGGASRTRFGWRRAFEIAASRNKVFTDPVAVPGGSQGADAHRRETT